jgi:Kdo2-lipid IVA lauroyltransferase/acyltransferase
MVACKRLADGLGYELKFAVLEKFSDDPAMAARELNAAVEVAISFAPMQYLWTYNRYKVPADVAVSTPNVIAQ